MQEEHPPIVSNIGMGSVLVNYYRKKDDKDDHIPKVSFFEFNLRFVPYEIFRVTSGNHLC